VSTRSRMREQRAATLLPLFPPVQTNRGSRSNATNQPVTELFPPLRARAGNFKPNVSSDRRCALLADFKGKE
jgi:hypothetical protein